MVVEDEFNCGERGVVARGEFSGEFVCLYSGRISSSRGGVVAEYKAWGTEDDGR